MRGSLRLATPHRIECSLTLVMPSPTRGEGAATTPRSVGWLEQDVTGPLLIEHHDGVDRVTLNRPDSLNALNPDLIDALNVYFAGLQRSRSTRVVVLKGAGASFCAWLDLKH